MTGKSMKWDHLKSDAKRSIHLTPQLRKIKEKERKKIFHLSLMVREKEEWGGGGGGGRKKWVNVAQIYPFNFLLIKNNLSRKQKRKGIPSSSQMWNLNPETEKLNKSCRFSKGSIPSCQNVSDGKRTDKIMVWSSVDLKSQFPFEVVIRSLFPLAPPTDASSSVDVSSGRKEN